MQIFDFTQISSKYPLLKPKDISFLNEFFNRPDILTVISDVEDKRKRLILAIRMASIILIISIGFIIYIFNGLNLQNNPGNTMGLYIIIFLMSIYGLYYNYIVKKFISNIKKDILSKMIESSDLGIKYSDNSNYFLDDLVSISENTDLIMEFDIIDFKEDSIEINDQDKGYQITGMEFATSEKTTDSKGKTHYNRNNHGYLMKIKFYNPKFKITSPITLLTQKETNFTKIYIFIFIVFTFIYAISRDPLIFIFLFLAFLITYFIQVHDLENLVKLENVEFEDKFDVYSEDDSTTRTILTPSFMYRIYDYVNKINKNRQYDFYFKDDYLYINYKIDNNYLEISFFKSLYLNISDYVEFYQELKNISALASDLKLSFYDKNFGLNNVIK